MICQKTIPIMTLGDFRELTKHLPDDKQIEVWNHDTLCYTGEKGETGPCEIYECTLVGLVHPLRIQAAEQD